MWSRIRTWKFWTSQPGIGPRFRRLDWSRSHIGAVLTLLLSFGLGGNAPRLAATDGALDSTWTLEWPFGPTPFNPISVIQPLPDGRLLLGGNFPRNDGQTVLVLRVRPDGSIDPSFSPVLGTGVSPEFGVHALVVQGDGRIVVGGSFESLGGVVRTNLARLLINGTVDPEYRPQLDVGDLVTSRVNALAGLADGRVVVAGRFAGANGLARTNLVRLRPDGTVDATFDARAAVSNFLPMQPRTVLKWLPDGRLLVLGDFLGFGNVSCDGLARLDASGVADPTFVPRFSKGVASSPTLEDILVQPDGRVVVAGRFERVNGLARTNLVRLLPDGSIDPSFAPTAPRDALGSGFDRLVGQADGRILVAGSFTDWGEFNRTNLVRLHWDGRLDEGFDAGDFVGRGNTMSPVDALAITADGGVVVSGYFRRSDGAARDFVLRLIGASSGPLSFSREPESVASGLGEVATFGVAMTGAPPWTFQWQFRGADLPGATAPLLTVAQVGPNHVGEYRVRVSHGASSVTSRPARLDLVRAEPGRLDPGFQPIVQLGIGGPMDRTLFALAPSGHVLVAGRFFEIDGQDHTNLARLLPNGAHDATFAPDFQATSSFVELGAVTVQPDGRSLVAGRFTHVNGIERKGVVRLLADGSTDPEFDPGEGLSAVDPTSSVWQLAVQSNGGILVAGHFEQFGGMPQPSLARLMPSGAVDRGFRPVIERDALGAATVEVVTLQPDGRVLIAGDFLQVGGLGRPGLARLLPDGRVDPDFSAVDLEGPGPIMNGSWIESIVVQPDGRILIGGSFNRVNGAARTGLARLQANGELEEAFAPFLGASAAPRSDPGVVALALEASGRIWVGGNFGSVNAGWAPNLARLEPDGSSDWSFTADPNYLFDPIAILIRPNGRVLVGNSTSSRPPQANSLTLLQLRGSPFTAPVFYSQPTNATRTIGEWIEWSVEASDNPATRLQWQRNEVDLPGATLPRLTLSNLSLADAGRYRLRASNALGASTSTVAVLTVTPADRRPGNVDVAFNPGRGIGGQQPFGKVSVYALSPGPNGSWLAGGDFDTFDGVDRPALVRLTAEGALDPGFNARFQAGSFVYRVASGKAGVAYAWGNFTNVAGSFRTNLVRLLPDGRLDPSFSVALGNLDFIDDLVELADGSLFAVGLQQPGGHFAWHLASDGHLLGSVSSVPAGAAWHILPTPNGGFIVSGEFSDTAANTSLLAVRLTADLQFDPSFQPRVPRGWTPYGDQLDAVGRWYVAVQRPNGGPGRLLRFNADGNLDSHYEPTPSPSYAFAVQSDGRVLLTWAASSANQDSELIRLNLDGSEDTSFQPTHLVGGTANVMRPVGADRILVGGDFSEANRSLRGGLARIWAGAPESTAPTLRFGVDDLSVASGEHGWLFAVTYGFPPPQLQWRFNGVDIPGATNPLLILPEAPASASGSYSLVAWNGAGQIESRSATVTFTPPPTLRTFRNPNGFVGFEFPSLPQHTHRIQTTRDLDSGFWDDDLRFDGDGDPKRFEYWADGDGFPEAGRFVRVRTQFGANLPSSVEGMQFLLWLQPSPSFSIEGEPLEAVCRQGIITVAARTLHAAEMGDYEFEWMGYRSARLAWQDTSGAVAGSHWTFFLRFENSGGGELAYRRQRAGEATVTGTGFFGVSSAPPAPRVPPAISRVRLNFANAPVGCAKVLDTNFDPPLALSSADSVHTQLVFDDPCAPGFGPQRLYELTFLTPTSGNFVSDNLRGTFSVERAP